MKYIKLYQNTDDYNLDNRENYEYYLCNIKNNNKTIVKKNINQDFQQLDDDLSKIGWNEESKKPYSNSVSTYTQVPQSDIDLYNSGMNIGKADKIDKFCPMFDASLITDFKTFSENHNVIAIPELHTKNIESMFMAFAYSDEITTIGPLDVSNVTNMICMCEGCTNLLSIILENSNKVTDTDRMFSNCKSLKELNYFDTSSVTIMCHMFYQCDNLIQIPMFNTLNVKNMDSMFDGCKKLTTIPEINTSNVETVNSMFRNCISLEYLPLLDFSKVTDTSDMLSNCVNLKDLKGFKGLKCNLDLSDCTLLTRQSILNIINEAAPHTDIIIKIGEINRQKITEQDIQMSAEKGVYFEFNVPFDEQGLKNIGWTDEDISYYKNSTYQYRIVPQSDIDLYNSGMNKDKINDITYYCPKFDTSDITDSYFLFSSCRDLISIPLLNTSNASSLAGLFSWCENLVSIPLLDTSNASDLGGMFAGCRSLKTIPQLDTRNMTLSYDGTRYIGMFNGCYNLENIPMLNTSKLLTACYMFYGCEKLTTIPQLNLSKVENTVSMFYNCNNLTTLPKLNLSSVTDARYMFDNCFNLKDVGGFVGLQVNIDLSYCNKLTRESLLNIIDCASSGKNITITIGEINYNKLTKEDIQKAFNKQVYFEFNTPLDIEGLKSIGWNDDDINFYKKITKKYNFVTPVDKQLYELTKKSHFQYYMLHDSTFCPMFDSSKNTSMSEMFTLWQQSKLICVPKFNTSNVEDINCMFQDCVKLLGVPELDLSKVTSAVGMFINCENLTDLGGLKGLKCDLDLSSSPKLTHESLMNIITKVGSPDKTIQYNRGVLSFGATNLSKLTDIEKKIAIDKGWTLA